MKGIDRLRAQVATDPEAQAQWEEHDRKHRPLALRCMAQIEAIFPPHTPSTRRRGGGKLAVDTATKEAACAILDAMGGHPIDTAEFQVAMAGGDTVYFLRMAAAAQHLRSVGTVATVFARHVREARLVAAGMMAAGDPKPSWRAIRREVAKRLGQAAITDTSTEWPRIKTAADLKTLRR